RAVASDLLPSPGAPDTGATTTPEGLGAGAGFAVAAVAGVVVAAGAAATGGGLALRPPGRSAASCEVVLLAILRITLSSTPRQGLPLVPRETVSSPETRVTRVPLASVTSQM